MHAAMPALENGQSSVSDVLMRKIATSSVRQSTLMSSAR